VANYIRPMILDRFLVTDQAAIVTGSGRGIGAASAIALAEAGADVVLAARTEEQVRDVAKQVEAAGRRAIVVFGDLNDYELMASLADTAWAELGRLDIVVNNMGGAMPRPLLDTSPGFMERAFRFNVTAGHALVRAAVPRMLEGDHPGGAIVNISSVMGHVGGRGYLAYGTVKGALEQYTRLAARDLAPRIRVNAIGVGSVATSALDVVMSSDELRTAMEEAVPLKRLGQVEDIAAAVLYLTSPAGAYVTGKILGVDGGLQSPNIETPIPDL
jgi:7-alpha-hydroxysteroid dehydrogenase